MYANAVQLSNRDVPRTTRLASARNGSNLPLLIGAVIYVRVSTKEQTENLSLPTQLRACEESRTLLVFPARTERQLMGRRSHSRSEVSLRKSAAGSGLQVALEVGGSRLVRELNDDVKVPRSA
jgi:hypothetical protein